MLSIISSVTSDSCAAAAGRVVSCRPRCIPAAIGRSVTMGRVKSAPLVSFFLSRVQSLNNLHKNARGPMVMEHYRQYDFCCLRVIFSYFFRRGVLFRVIIFKYFSSGRTVNGKKWCPGTFMNSSGK